MRSLLATGLMLCMALCWGCPDAPDPLQTLVAGSETAAEAVPAGEAWADDAPSDVMMPAGACCLPQGCSQDLTPAQCELNGGQFLGAGTDCFSCVSEDQIVAALQSVDSDGDGCNDWVELVTGTNRLRLGDCLDIDGDGIPNEIDPDVDGDGVPNAQDDDIDGDGIPNGSDLDPDGDGKMGHDDPDEDGDGLSDRWDLDHDGDDELDANEDDEPEDADDDDDDDDDDEDGPEDQLLNLVKQLRDGKITEADRNAIANEIVKHFDAAEDKADIQYILQNVVELSKVVQRQWVTGVSPPGIEAIDQVYDQLDKAIQLARGDSKEPLEKEKFPAVMQDFKARAKSMVSLARTFSTLRFDELGFVVDRMRGVFDPAKLQEIAEQMGDYVDPYAWNNHDKESAELLAVEHGTSSLGKSFGDAEALNLLQTTARLRERANRLQGTQEEKDSKYQSLLDRMDEVSKDVPDINDALDQVEQEDDEQNGDDGSNE